MLAGWVVHADLRERRRLREPAFALAVGGFSRPAPASRIIRTNCGHSRWLGAGQVAITGPVARGQVQVLRAQSDAILVGIGTARADDPELTCRLPGLTDRSPIRIVLDHDLRLPPYGKLALSARAVPVIAVAAEPPRFDDVTDKAFLARRSVLDEAGVDILLIGDSLGNVLQGRGSTAPVSLEDMVYHTFCVSRGHKWAWIVADLPFDSYHASKEEAWKSAAALVKAGAHMVKLEGGGWTTETVRFISERGIPVCVHLGFTPQTVNALGGFKVQGRDEESAARMKRETREAIDAGAAMLLYEMVPAALAAEITAASPVPVIGIGAGVGTSGQVLVLHDMLNITPGRKPRFVKNFMEGRDSVLAGVKAYVDEVKAGSFPVNEVHGF